MLAPIFKLNSPLFDILAMAMAPTIASSNRSFGELRLIAGGGVDVWSLEYPRAGRGRRYNLTVIDEGAHGGPEMTGTWSASIRPGRQAIIASTPNGIAEDNFFWRICNEASCGFAEFVAATLSNPFIPRAEIEELCKAHNPLVFASEFEARFVNLAGAGLFKIEAMLNEGSPWEMLGLFNIVYAMLDSGIRGGQEHDASAVVYVGLNVHMPPHGLFITDWEAVEVGAGDIELWFAGVRHALKGYAEKARLGSKGVSVERAGLGEMLLAKGNALGVHCAEDQSGPGRARQRSARSPCRQVHEWGHGQADGDSMRADLEAHRRRPQSSAWAGRRLQSCRQEAWKRTDDLVDALIYAVRRRLARLRVTAV
jgi:hypothetical protein